MDDEKGRKGRIDRILVGDPIAAGERTLRPIARVGGWGGHGEGERGRGFGALFRVQPLEVRVSELGRAEYTVSISDPTRDAMRRMALAALFVAAVSALLLLVGLFRPRT